MNDDIKELPVRDQEAAMQVVGGNADLAQELFHTFLQGVEPQMREIRQLHHANHWAKLEESVHKLHGGAAYCGVPALKSALKALEHAAATGESAEIQRRMAALEGEIQRLLSYAANQD